ncbi:TetR/AcrR family transcriptional regulator [Clostridium paridis]|uniref:TetR/AcrR family transcriptional regulator n=1 Tax=Clostridium paridis TaxID=2803863 RepID=A0A937FJI3_9CLOT|nr:TetR/AcrR family transcriptional regulator [Clostridium paridis]MBL4933632.1 TetR/AcrR family transcriptional regulator [Clostridium paridis]
MNKTKKGIFEAAIKIFSNNGYKGATMDEIALEAGVAKGTLYYHFKSKEEIFRFIIIEGIGVLTDEISVVANIDNNPEDNLREICITQLTVLYRNKDFFKVLMSQLWGQEIRQIELREHLQKYIKNIEVYIKDAMDKGFIKNGDSYFIAYTFFGSLVSAAIYELVNQDKEIDEVVNNLIEYTFHGLSAK